jgi:hypothetical protein
VGLRIELRSAQRFGLGGLYDLFRGDQTKAKHDRTWIDSFDVLERLIFVCQAGGAGLYAFESLAILPAAARPSVGAVLSCNGSRPRRYWGHWSDGTPRYLTACGILMHSSLAVTADGLPLGLIAIKFWSRKKFKGANALKKKINPTRVPIEEKESI